MVLEEGGQRERNGWEMDGKLRNYRMNSSLQNLNIVNTWRVVASEAGKSTGGSEFRVKWSEFLFFRV